MHKKDIDEGITKVPDYILRNGLRYVEKYTYVFRTFVKGRWVGQKLLDLLINEFKSTGDEGTIALISEYFRNAIQEEKIKINGLPTTEDYVIQLPDELSRCTVG
jgi:hypothetical protein